MILTRSSLRAIDRSAAIKPNSIVSVSTSGIEISRDLSLNSCSGPK
ncbi:MAG: hypothetical protein ACTSQP_19725 [Promethearchaeota archaeon]